MKKFLKKDLNVLKILRKIPTCRSRAGSCDEKGYEKMGSKTARTCKARDPLKQVTGSARKITAPNQ